MVELLVGKRNPPQSYGELPAIWDHTVFTWHNDLNPPRMTSGRITYKLTWGEFFTPLLFVHILKLIY